MASVVGFNFTKVLAEKKSVAKGKIDIGTNVTLKDVEDAKFSFSKDQQSIKVSFVFTTKYEPNVGIIQLEGNLVLLLGEKEGKAILESWSKTKQLGKDVMQPVLNNILMRCSVESLTLSKDMNLPPPVRLPRVEVKQGEPVKKASTKKKSPAKKATKK